MDNQNTQPEMKLMTCPLCFEKCNYLTSFPVNSIKGRMTKVIHPKCMARLGIKKLDFKKQGQIKHEPYEYLQELYNNGEKYNYEKAKNDRLKYLRDDVSDEPSKMDEIEEQFEAAGVTDLFGTKKEVRHLPEILRDDETVLYATSGFESGKTVLVVLTDQRLVFVNNNWTWGSDFKEFPFDHINSVSYSKKMMLANVAITNGANTTIIENVNKDTAPILVDRLRKAMDEYEIKRQRKFMQPSQPVQQHSQTSNLGQIKELKELLDMDAITQEEFDLKKKELLGI
ncbi:hypothetical protein LMG30237_ALEAABJJ_00374 [Fructobacillus tropaeoli]|uniref:PH domain-containing protein n=1 Tax=Fructobacillus tropaeoli TaxID=709323 RepID=UPI002D8B28B6|nr:hypothetical protein LMG30237_ALEAABJJ_00374 [Fructobacillus tropaeoli]